MIENLSQFLGQESMDTFVFDLDGTLALIDHRRHFVSNGNNDWDAFYKACTDDLPNKPVMKVCRVLKNYGYKIAILSGRSETVRTQTIDWLSKYLVKYDLLIMRPEKDYTPDEELKLKWIDLYDLRNRTVCIFEDRKKVVDMWRNQGLCCLQVAEGDF